MSSPPSVTVAESSSSSSRDESLSRSGTDPLDRERDESSVTANEAPMHSSSSSSAGIGDVMEAMQATNIGSAQAEQAPAPQPQQNPYQDRQPHPSLAPEDVIEIQLGAMKFNDLPHVDAGIEICFRFASPANRIYTGPVGRFIRMLHNPLYSVMLNYDSIKFIPANSAGTRWRLQITKGGQQSCFMWSLSKQTAQPFEGCWMTDNVLLVRE